MDRVTGRTAVGRAAASDPYAYVDPELVAALRDFPRGLGPPDADNLAALRAASRPLSQSSAPQLQPRPAVASGPEGEAPVLIFDPSPGVPNRPATLYIHGGGYVLGRADTNLQRAQDIAEATGCPVVSVDYAVAPEAVFPNSLHQNYAALAWLHRTAGELGVDNTRIAICGDSAGGGHAAMLAIAARDRGGAFPIAFQCLIYPMLDDRTGSTDHPPPHLGHFLWTAAANRFGWSSLLGAPAGSPAPPPGAVPARVADLRGLPSTFIGVGAIDLLCEEGIDYARRLVLAGVRTELTVVPGAFHGFDVVTRDARPSLAFRTAWLGALRRGLGLS